MPQIQSLCPSVLKNLRYLVPKSRKMGYIGWLENGLRNLGDEAMYQAFQDMFPQFSVLPFKATAKIEWLEKSALRRRMYDAVLLGGGTLINSRGTLNTLKLAQQRYSPTFVFGTGVKNPEFWDVHARGQNCLREWIEPLHQCAFVGVRGPLSRKVLEEHGFTTAEITGDPALYWARETVTPKKGSKRLAINVGISHGNVWGTEGGIFEFAVRFSKVMLAEGWKLHFFVAWPKDLAFTKDIVRGIGRPVGVFEAYRSIPDALDFLEHDCDMLVGQKLHSVIFAACTHTPAVMLEYQPKCRDFMLSMGLEDFVVRTDALALDEVLARVNKLHESIGAFQEKIKERIDFYRDIQIRKRDRILTVVQGKQ